MSPVLLSGLASGLAFTGYILLWLLAAWMAAVAVFGLVVLVDTARAGQRCRNRRGRMAIIRSFWAKWRY